MPITIPQQLPLIIGHRGASRDAPENTLESFRLAWQQGADGIEADFRLTGDGRIVCMHDATTGRTTGISLVVASSSLTQLRRLDAGFRKEGVPSGARIPTLEEVLAALPAGSRFNIEIKSGTEIIDPLAKVLALSGVAPEKIRLLSFSAPLLAELKRELPGWRTLWLCEYRHYKTRDIWYPSRDKILEVLRSCGANGLASADRSILDREFVKRLKGAGMEIHVWTVDRIPAAERLCALGVDAIMTNRPGWLRQRLAGAVPA